MKKLLITLCIACTAAAICAKDIKVEKFRFAGPFIMQQPVLIDSVTYDNAKFDTLSLLKANINLDIAKTATQTVDSVLPLNTSGCPTLNILHTTFSNTSFAKTKINIKKLKNYTLYVDGKEQKAGAELSLTPRTHDIIIKYLSMPEKADTVLVSLTPSNSPTGGGQSHPDGITLPLVGESEGVVWRAAFAQDNPEDNGINLNTPTFVPKVAVEETQMNGEDVLSVKLNTLTIVPPRTFKNDKEKKKWDRLVYNLKKVMPISKEIRGIVIETYETVSQIPSEKERKKHLKQVEKDIKADYTPRMKKLTLNQGKLLIKLVHRETQSSGYNLLQAFLGPVRAGFYQAFAWTFGASLNKKYDPEGEDKEMELLVKQIEAGQL